VRDLDEPGSFGVAAVAAAQISAVEPTAQIIESWCTYAGQSGICQNGVCSSQWLNNV
jgi:hypothetical protein